MTDVTPPTRRRGSVLDDAIMRDMLSTRIAPSAESMADGNVDEDNEEDEMERMERMYVMLRWSKKYRRAMVQNANAHWENDIEAKTINTKSESDCSTSGEMGNKTTSASSFPLATTVSWPDNKHRGSSFNTGGIFDMADLEAALDDGKEPDDPEQGLHAVPEIEQEITSQSQTSMLDCRSEGVDTAEATKCSEIHEQKNEFGRLSILKPRKSPNSAQPLSSVRFSEEIQFIPSTVYDEDERLRDEPDDVVSEADSFEEDRESKLERHLSHDTINKQLHSPSPRKPRHAAVKKIKVALRSFLRPNGANQEANVASHAVRAV